jgi:plastocyanin
MAAARPKPAPHHAADTLRGKVTLSTAGGQKLGAADYAHTLVYFVPASGAKRPRPGHYTVYTHNRDFDPDWIAIPQGSTVTFTNLDQVTHNVFSVTPGSAFDLGYESAGKSVSHTFNRAGLVLISCHVHRYMKGSVVVIPSRYATTVAANGSFTLSHLPGTTGTLYFRNPRSAPATQSIHKASDTIQQNLVISKPSVKTRIDVGAR